MLAFDTRALTLPLLTPRTYLATTSFSSSALCGASSELMLLQLH